MHLNLPIADQLEACDNLLIVGAGGGFDLYVGLPVYFEMRLHGKTVHLANLSFLTVPELKATKALTQTLVGVTPDSHGPGHYFPEKHLAQFIQMQFPDEEATVWLFELAGVETLLADYRALIAHLNIDGILLVDGGVDSLARGDEVLPGTPLEDFASLCAVDQLDLPLRMLACLGFGIERETHHAHILENIAALTKAEAFLGACALLPQMDAVQSYVDAVQFAFDQGEQVPSVINASVVSAVRGEFGDFHLTERTKGNQLWISPLMTLYWFFDLPAVAERNLWLPHVRDTRTKIDLFRAMTIASGKHPRRPLSEIRLV